jgi:hypothetical protein
MIKRWEQSIENVKKFSERPNVNKVVVENFLMRIGVGSVPSTIENLVDDAKKHNWNNETIEAILDGILASNELEINDIISTNNVTRRS